MARYVAKNLVVTGLIDKVEIELCYSSEKSELVAIMINSFGHIFDSDLINEEDVGSGYDKENISH